jgi:hypothetical protein
MNRPPISLPKLFELWQSDMRTDKIAEALGCTRGKLYNLAYKHKLGSRPESLHSLKKSVHPDPTPSEIEERAAAIRATWTAQDRSTRMASAYRLKHVTATVFFDTRDSYREAIFAD